MAIELHEGEYALQQETTKKTLFQFKLTDSALKAIEVYRDELVGKRTKPSIKFDGNQGVIQIPTGDGNDVQTFTFQLAELNQSASIDCLQQYHTRAAQGMVSVLGGIQQKITINANDDSYNATRKRMEIVKEQEKNISTKVIKQPSSSKLGKNKPLRRQILDQKQGNFTHGRNQTPPPSRSMHSFTRSASPLTATSSMRSVSPVSSVGDLAGVRNKTKPVLSSLPSTSQPPAQNSTGRPLHERVLHYLALRPIKYADLINRLSRGTFPPDKSKLQNILQQVATTRTIRPGVIEYTLLKNLYSEVQIDWIGYNDEERSTIRRKVSQDAPARSESRKRPMVSPDSTPKDSVNSTQRALQEATFTNPLQKKQRVSLYKPNSSGPRSVSPLETSSPMLIDDSQPKAINSSSIVDLDSSNMSNLGLSETNVSRRFSPKTHGGTDGGYNRPPSANRLNKSSFSPSSTQPSPSKIPPPLNESFPSYTVNSKRSKGCDLSPNKSDVKYRSHVPERDVTKRRDQSDAPNDSMKSSMLDFDSNKGISPSDKDEFFVKYRPINYPEQRDQYNRDFNAEYQEYRRLHNRVATESKRFEQWQQELNQQKKGTEKYKGIARQVYSEYHKLKKNVDYRKDRQRMQYLHRKLKHIKDLVLEFDCRERGSRHDGDAGSDKRDAIDRPNPHRRSNDVAQKRPLLTA